MAGHDGNKINKVHLQSNNRRGVCGRWLGITTGDFHQVTCASCLRKALGEAAFMEKLLGREAS